jgi:hypothetical protein
MIGTRGRFHRNTHLPRSGHIGDLRVPLEELREYADLLDRIAGNRDLLSGMTGIARIFQPGHVRNLRVPLEELKEYADLLDRIAGSRDSLNGVTSLGSLRPGHVRDLHVPIDELREYEAILDRIIEKLKEKDQSEHNLRSRSGREKAA